MTRASARRWEFLPLDSRLLRLRAVVSQLLASPSRSRWSLVFHSFLRPIREIRGIQVVPEKRGDPRVTVKSRDLDPGISTIPDVAPPAHKGINPPV